MSHREPSLELVPSGGRRRLLRAETPALLVERVAAALGHEASPGRLTAEGGLLACLACGHPELYTQRDFPRPVGITIVVLAAVLAPFTSYVSLFVAALLDAAFYHLAPAVVVCYACHARHRGLQPSPRHPAFDREIEERLLYGKRAVMGKPMRPGGTADAPEPEH